MLRKSIAIFLCMSAMISIPSYLMAAQVSIEGGLVKLPAGGGIQFPGGQVLSDPAGITGPKGDPGPAGVCSIVSGGIHAGPVSMPASSSTDLASLNLTLAGNKTIVVLATINPLTWQPSPIAYGGKNHTLHVNITWKVYGDGNEIGSYLQTAEQNIMQIQAAGNPTPSGLKTITLRAVNASYWSLDDSPYGTTPIGSNSFNVVLSAMEI